MGSLKEVDHSINISYADAVAREGRGLGVNW
jgi:hypothetical protein